MKSQTEEKSFWQQIKQGGISFSLVDGKLMAWPEEKLTPKLIEKIRRYKHEILCGHKIKYSAKNGGRRFNNSITFAELNEIDMPELQIVESELWFHLPHTFNAASTANVSWEDGEEKISMVKNVFRRFKSIKSQEVSMETNGQEERGQFRYQQDSKRYHRFKLETNKGIMGMVYIPKDVQVPKKITLEFNKS